MILPDRQAALAALAALGVPEKAAQMAAYHKTARRCLGVANPQIDALCRDWRAAAKSLGAGEVPARATLARGLWDSDVFEARIAAAKLLTQARIRDDGEVWALIASWVGDFDGWAVADHAAAAGSRRLSAHPARLDELEAWTAAPSMWTRRAALVFTLPWARGRNLKPEDQARRERVLGWAERYVEDHDRFIQKAVGWWLRSLSIHDPARVLHFIDDHGARMTPFARREALRRIA